MDSVVDRRPARGRRPISTPQRITAAVDALADKHAGREDVFRAAVAQLLKAELIEARAAAQAQLLKDRHGRRCAERLCFVQDEIIRILFAAATGISIARRCPPAPSAWPWWRPAAMAAA